MEEQKLIDIDSVIHVVDSFDDTGYSLDTVQRITDGIHAEIEKIPIVDAVPVVRCKDCKFFVRSWCIIHETPMLEKGFCSDGERKDGE